MADRSTLLSSKAKPYVYALASFLAAWQIDDFSFEARSILGALTACVLGYASPRRK
jgi:hypothetical protein